jgi:hypothetical protein
VKGRIGGAEGAVDFVGGDVKEAEGVLFLAFERFVEGQSSLKQGEGAVDVGLKESLRS